MAEIDKALPNTETVVKVPAEEELVEAKEEIVEEKDKQGNIEVTMDEEGGAEHQSLSQWPITHSRARCDPACSHGGPHVSPSVHAKLQAALKARDRALRNAEGAAHDLETAKHAFTEYLAAAVRGNGQDMLSPPTVDASTVVPSFLGLGHHEMRQFLRGPVVQMDRMPRLPLLQ